jgi:hypothetical protein
MIFLSALMAAHRISARGALGCTGVESNPIISQGNVCVHALVIHGVRLKPVRVCRWEGETADQAGPGRKWCAWENQADGVGPTGKRSVKEGARERDTTQ